MAAVETRGTARIRKHRQQLRCHAELQTQIEPRISAIRLPRTGEETLRATALLPAHPDIPQEPSSDGSTPARVPCRYYCVSEILLGAGCVAPGACGVLAAVLGHTHPASAPVPARHRTCHPRLPLPPRGQLAARACLRQTVTGGDHCPVG